MRSASIPPTGESSIIGICPENATSPSMNADPVTRYMIHAIATCCTQVPISDTTWPKKYRRKSRPARARKVWFNDDNLLVWNVARYLQLPSRARRRRGGAEGDGVVSFLSYLLILIIHSPAYRHQ